MINKLKNLFKKKEIKYKEIKEVTHKAELQLIFKDNSIICTDVNFTVDNEYENPIKDFINTSYRYNIMHIFDKSNKYNVAIQSIDIKKILYKPDVTINIKQIEVK